MLIHVTAFQFVGAGLADGFLFRCWGFVPPRVFLGRGSNWLFDFVGGLFPRSVAGSFGGTNLAVGVAAMSELSEGCIRTLSGGFLGKGEAPAE